eukprot:CAMPEP_0183359154 /NCGR_PEP_ID=MMETSP0164_2-20130417/51343_1 /TAXON_ID=221442 /ORGANISM="Coccolithus pelagicus ssp braarudi, Strain PLY182g" /LENGTH=31 /DNA_ID= /DNA_START= /DNA_END= /DNA_ORIENTATION=
MYGTTMAQMGRANHMRPLGLGLSVSVWSLLP